jgi:NADH-ubiquinone oxidoreductase chain 5
MFIFLFLCLTKRAQFPFSTWLPLAIAAPTPVSSLVHSRTLVTAGFYLLFRYSNFNSLYHLNSFVLVFCLLTLFYSGVNGLLEIDFKKIIALSTLRQLSLIFISIRIDIKIISFFHLFTHSFFKSLLFVRVGIIIHQFFSNQDLRNYNTLFMNILKIRIIFSLLSLIGILFTSGFFRKDFILEKIFLINSSIIIVWLFFIIIFLTIFYSLRLLHTIFFLNFQQVLIYQRFRFYIIFGIFFLSFLSLVIGNFML